MGKSIIGGKRALSVGGRWWQLPRALALLALASGALAALAPGALAAPGGKLGSLPLGHYSCELPGDALGPEGIPQPGEDFTVVLNSAYLVGAEHGTYLLTGRVVLMTSGPKRGTRYRRTKDGLLRRLAPDGADAPLRCVREAPERG